MEGQLADLRLQALALGDIPGNPVITDNHALFVTINLGQHLAPHQPAILAALLYLERTKLRGTCARLIQQRGIQHRADTRTGFVGQQLKHRPTDHLVSRETAQPLIGRADVGHDEMAVHAPVHILGILGEHAVKRLALMQRAGTLHHQRLQGIVLLPEALQRIDLTVLHTAIRDGNTAVGDHPCRAFPAKDQHQPRHLLRQLLAILGQMDMEKAERQHQVIRQVLQSQVEHLDTNSPRHLGEILTGDTHPLIMVTHQILPTAGVAGEVLAKTPGQPLITGGVHLDVLVEQLTDEALAVLLHGADTSWSGR